ncbi:hypothetical protein FUAX_29620 [Fulvitalea axinellae]|uniref:DUF4959 domain-containing protein n=1 Tax=Fulvitalea axinellae TaxID=1182444 RepID=A0AAU9DDJ0_9BACT|nr:hypothetical protein FUAX_29620 [Fulvitalea axinellae]
MKKSINNLFAWFCCVATLLSCSDDKPEMIQHDGKAPGPVTDLKVENLNGASKISYSLPADKDLLFVKAVYSPRQGETSETRASYYDNSLVVSGFGDTKDREVELYAVDRSGNVSVVAKTTIAPLTPPVELAFNSLRVVPDFGGVHAFWENESMADLGVTLMELDSLQKWQDVETMYSSQAEADFAVRGYNTDERHFAVIVSDRWGNLSDTLKVKLKPLFEEELDKSKFKKLKLPSDAGDAWGWRMERLWDNNKGSGFHTAQGNPRPHWFTFDMGVEAQLSRYKIFQRAGGYMFDHGNPRVWEVWGATDPDPEGGWDGWTKLVECESIKPSGLPIDQNSDEDRALIKRGEEFIFPIDAPPVRYIRFKIYDSWSGGSFFHAMEVYFWGKVLDGSTENEETNEN